MVLVPCARLLAAVAVTITLTIFPSHAFTIAPQVLRRVATGTTRTHRGRLSSTTSSDDGGSDWTGEVTTDDGGAIKGCTITQVPGTLTTWTVAIDGVEADLGKFSAAIYRKITADAKQQRFQGFRPGTIPPHLQGTYHAFAMNEAALEATLEALGQNNIRPFEEERDDIMVGDVSIPPPVRKKKKRKGGRKNKATAEATAAAAEEEVEVWLTFPTMKEAIDAGWKPGQSFSFVARNVKGQEVKDGATISSQMSPVGAGGAAYDLNKVAAQVASNTWKE